MMKKWSVPVLLVILVTGAGTHAFRPTISFWKKPSTGCDIVTNAWSTVNLEKTWTGPIVAASDLSNIYAIGQVGTSKQIYIMNQASGSEWWVAITASQDWRAIAASSDAVNLVAVAYGGQIYTSTDGGANWTARNSNRNWISVASSSDGTKLVAVVENGQIYTSTDSGANWVARDSSRAWSSVASSSDGTKLVATVNGGQVYTSTDSGANWVARDSNRAWVSVASSSNGTKLVAAVSGGRLYTSTDSGANWTQRDSNRNWTSVASSSDGARLIATITNSTTHYYSTNSGANWTSSASGSYSAANGAFMIPDGSGYRLMMQAYYSGSYYSGGLGSATYSSGFAWTGVTEQPFSQGKSFLRSSSDGTTVALTVRSRLYLSKDGGTTWTEPVLPIDKKFSIGGVSVSGNGTKIAIIAFDGVSITSGLKVYVSTDSGTTWTDRTPSVGFSQALTYSRDGSTIYLAEMISTTATAGRIFRTTNDGSSWSALGTARYYADISTSSNGVKTLAAESGTTPFTASDGYLYTTTNSGGAWTQRASVAGWFLTASSDDGAKLAALGIEDPNFSVYVSTDSGVNWTKKTAAGLYVMGMDVSAAGTKMVTLDMDGDGDGIADIYISTDSGANWSTKTTTVPWDELLTNGGGTVALSPDGNKIYVLSDAGAKFYATQCN